MTITRQHTDEPASGRLITEPRSSISEDDIKDGLIMCRRISDVLARSNKIRLS